jgi:hypothetical protein
MLLMQGTFQTGPSAHHCRNVNIHGKSPTEESPTEESPTRDSSTKESLSKESLSKESSTRDSSTKESLSKESSTRDSSTKESLSNESSAKDSPTRASPTEECRMEAAEGERMDSSEEPDAGSGDSEVTESWQDAVSEQQDVQTAVTEELAKNTDMDVGEKDEKDRELKKVIEEVEETEEAGEAELVDTAARGVLGQVYSARFAAVLLPVHYSVQTAN